MGPSAPTAVLSWPTQGMRWVVDNVISGGDLIQANLWLPHVPSPHGNPSKEQHSLSGGFQSPKTPSASVALLTHALPAGTLLSRWHTSTDCPPSAITVVHEGKVGSQPRSWLVPILQADKQLPPTARGITDPDAQHYIPLEGKGQQATSEDH